VVRAAAAKALALPGPAASVGRAPDGAGGLMIPRTGPDPAGLSPPANPLPDPLLTARLLTARQHGATVPPPPTPRKAA
jgi:hypothetical protein